MQNRNGNKINRVNNYASFERKAALRQYYEKKDGIEFQKYLYDINLPMYSNYINPAIMLEQYLFESLMDKNIKLHPEQIECLSILNEGKDLLLSAPTSFGKTFLILEYLYRNIESFNDILFIVPTIALRNELYAKIQKNFSNEYNIVINNFDEKSEKNIYLLLPERMEEKEFLEEIRYKQFDACIIDEVYKLGKVNNDQRKIIFNKAYISMLTNSKQLIMLGPFMKDVKFNRLGKDRNIYKYYSNYSPVLNELVNSNLSELQVNLDNCFGRKQILFCPTPAKVETNILNINIQQKTILHQDYIECLEEMYFPEWNLIQLLKKGLIYHYGPLPKFLREFIEDLYNDSNSGYDVIFATSTLLEGINTPTSVMHILDTDYDNKGLGLNKFELNNLIGRVGRLSSNVKGDVYIYTQKAYEMIEENFSEEITFEAESIEYDSYEDAKSLGKEVSQEHQKQFEITKTEIEENLPIGNQLSLEEINLKYYNNFKNSKGILIEKIKEKNSSFKIQYALISHYININVTGYYDPYIILMILNGNSLHDLLENQNDKNEFILKYFKAIAFIDYEMGKLINLLQLPSLLDQSYEIEAVKLVKLYFSFSNKSEIYKTAIDIGFSENDATTIDNKLKDYNFINSQELLKHLLSNEFKLELSIFGNWKLKKLSTIISA